MKIHLGVFICMTQVVSSEEDKRIFLRVLAADTVGESLLLSKELRGNFVSSMEDLLKRF